MPLMNSWWSSIMKTLVAMHCPVIVFLSPLESFVGMDKTMRWFSGALGSYIFLGALGCMPINFFGQS